MDKDNIFTMASVQGSAVSADDLAAAEEALGTAEMTESRQGLREYAGGFTPAKTRAMAEYKKFLDFVMNRNLPGIHPDDVRPLWMNMFGSLAPGQLSSIIDSLEIDGALDKPVYERVKRIVRKAMSEDIGKIWMDYGHYGSDTDAPPDHDTSSWTPLDDVEDDPNEILTTDYVSHPFKEKKISETKWLRTFARDTHSEELVWHRDREDRIVRVVEGSGWKIQMDGQLPIDLKPGSVHRIPARSWHRVLMGESASGLTVLVEKLKKGDKVKVDDKKATVKVPDGRGDLVGVDFDDPDDMEMVPSKDIEKLDEKKKKLPGNPEYYVGSKTKKTKSNKQMAQEIDKCAKEPRPKSCYDEWSADKTYKKNEVIDIVDEVLDEALDDMLDDILTEKLSKKTRETLKKKAEKANMPLGALTGVYRKGLAAWLSGHKQGTPQHAWAMGRVNSFISGGKARKVDKSEWKKVQKHRK